ncbi:MAG: branched-chain amino acid ABC transporter permease [Dehalococcoidia bacterium]|nr:branched-chain amino acid ABC transporter permease [Dehalococcoidia bacterium]
MTTTSQGIAWFRTEWTPWHTTTMLVAVTLIAGALPWVKMSLVVNGLFLAAIIALGAIGLSLIFGILKFANVAHGDYMMMGAYVTFFIVESVLEPLGLEGVGLGPFTFGYPLLIALPIGAAIVAGGSILLDIGIYRRLRNRGGNVGMLSMASLGVAIALRGLVQIIWSTDAQSFPRESRQVFRLPMDVRVPPDSIFIGIAAVALVAGIYVILTHTKMGKAMRATADNPDLARVTGINTQQVIWWTWAIGGGLAAIAGILLSVSQAQMLPIMGWKFLIPLFAAVILGGIGNPYGALVGAFVIGVTMEMSTQWINPSYKPAVAFGIMLAMLLARPRGLFGGSQ